MMKKKIFLLLLYTAKFPFKNWEQFSAITSNQDFSRTTNVSESIHSGLNRNFPRKINLNNTIEKLFNFKKESIMALSALEPKSFFGVKKIRQKNVVFVQQI